MNFGMTLTIFILVMKCLLSFCQDQCHRTIYINNQQANSIQPDGSFDSPFTNLDDGFAVFEKFDEKPCHFQFLIAPSAEAYPLRNLSDDSHQAKALNLTLELWQDHNSFNNEAILLLNRTALSFTHIESFHLRNVKIIGNNSVINLFKANLYVENLQVNVTGNLQDFFVNVEEAKVVEIKGLIYSPNQKGTFFSYYSKRSDIKPDIMLRDIEILAAGHHSVTALVASLTLDYPKHRGKVVIKKVRLNYAKRVLFNFYPNRIKTNFVIEGFEDVYFGGLDIQDQAVFGLEEKIAVFSKIDSLIVDTLNISDNNLSPLSKSFGFLLFIEIQNLTISNLVFFVKYIRPRRLVTNFDAWRLIPDSKSAVTEPCNRE